jgi:hypothetical protein
MLSSAVIQRCYPMTEPFLSERIDRRPQSVEPAQHIHVKHIDVDMSNELSYYANYSSIPTNILHP